MGHSKPSLNDLRIERKPSPGANPLIWVLSAAAVLLLLLALWWFTRPRPVAVPAVLAREASSTAGKSPERTVLNASGYVTARRAATVSSKVTGKVSEVLIEEGMKVKEGQVLARLDQTNVKASLDLAEAQLVSAHKSLDETRARIKEAELNLRRIMDLAKNNISAQADLDHAEAEAASYKARLEQQRADVVVAEKQLASWQQQLEDTVIRAPFSGIVTSKNAQPGEMISPVSAGGGFTRTGICTIVDMESLEVEIDVNESYINRVEAGQPVTSTLDAYPDWKIPCKVIAIIPTADRQKSTVRVRVGFDKLDPRILPEMSIKVAFREINAGTGTAAAATRNVIVPSSAVAQDNGRHLVMVIRNGRAEQRAVTVASSSANEAVISSGLAPGETVASPWPSGLKEGAAVKPTP
jgi:HlyD family secretion protein